MTHFHRWFDFIWIGGAFIKFSLYIELPIFMRKKNIFREMPIRSNVRLHNACLSENQSQSQKTPEMKMQSIENALIELKADKFYQEMQSKHFRSQNKNNFSLFVCICYHI